MFIGTTPQYAALSAIQVPSSSLNLHSLVLLLRDLFKPDDIRVSGDLTVISEKKVDDRLAAVSMQGGKGQEIASAQPSTYVLQLRYVRGDLRQARTVSASDFDQLITKAAEALLDLSDPHILASYQYGRRAWVHVDEILDRVLGSGVSSSNVKWALTLRGQRLLDLNRSGEAVRYFEQVVQLDANVSGYSAIDSSRNRQRAIAHTNWGNALQKDGNHDGAVEQYRRALDIDPKYAVALFNWGNALETVRDYNGAIEKYKQAAAIDPGNAAIFNSWGVLLRIKGDNDGAIEKYKRATDIDPNYAVAFNSWGVALAAKKDGPGSIEKYKRAIAIDPQFAMPFYNWGLALSRLEDYDGAIEKYRRAVEINPKYIFALNNWGVALAAKKDYEGAIQKYKAATDIDPAYVRGFSNWAKALAALGKHDDAAAMRKRANDLEARGGLANQVPNTDIGATATK